MIANKDGVKGGKVIRAKHTLYQILLYQILLYQILLYQFPIIVIEDGLLRPSLHDALFVPPLDALDSSSFPGCDICP